MEPLIIEPIRISYLWGYEDWCISAHQRADCLIQNGPYQGMHLSQLWQNYRELFGNMPGEVFPLLIKLIDTDLDVSIQVHPDDAYASAHEHGALGKSECWYILNLRKGTDTAIIGNRAADMKQAEELIAAQNWTAFLNEVPIHAGSFLQINPGTIHAVHGGTRFLETQQNSDITYRLYDYNRLQNGKPRQLHTTQAIACMNVPDHPDTNQPAEIETAYGSITHLVQCPRYTAEKIVIHHPGTMEFNHLFETVSVLSGSGMIGDIPVHENTFIILPHDLPAATWSGDFTAIVSWPPDQQR